MQMISGNTKQQEVTGAAIYICSHQTFPLDSFGGLSWGHQNSG